MTDEEYQRLKEAEKEHLRAKKKLQETLQALRRKQGVRDAVQRMARSAQSALDRASDLIGRLAAETARGEARLDLSLGERDEVDAASASDDEELASFEEERRAARARTLIRQMKQPRTRSEGPPSHRQRTESSRSDEASPSDGRGSAATSSDEDLSTSSTDDLPDKTIGRMR